MCDIYNMNGIELKNISSLENENFRGVPVDTHKIDRVVNYKNTHGKVKEDTVPVDLVDKISKEDLSYLSKE